MLAYQVHDSFNMPKTKPITQTLWGVQVRIQDSGGIVWNWWNMNGAVALHTTQYPASRDLEYITARFDVAPDLLRVAKLEYECEVVNE